MTENFSKLRRISLADEIVDQILNRIRRGKLKPGDRLPSEIDLSTQLGVSRSSVREALKALETLGAIERTTSGTVVGNLAATKLFTLISRDSLLTQMEIADIYEARRILEIELTTLALRNITQQDIRHLNQLAEAMRDISLDDHAEYMALDCGFHYYACELSGNRILIAMWEIAYGAFAELRRRVPLTRAFRETSDARHRALVSALTAMDPSRVREVVSESLTVGEKDLLGSTATGLFAD